MKTGLTKQDVAIRQLITAIRLFFDDGDPISIFSLAANSWEIIDVLCNEKNIDSVSNQTRENISNGKDLKYDYINSPYRNFFKHADRDPKGTLQDFEASHTDSILFLGVEDYTRLFNKSPIELQVFQLWFIATNMDKVSDAKYDEFFQTISDVFPNIKNISRQEKLLMGKNLLIKTGKDENIINDKRTEVV